jgi:hypothetical protein
VGFFFRLLLLLLVVVVVMMRKKLFEGSGIFKSPKVEDGIKPSL